ncbi:MAG: hypothetical protein IKD08_01475 [Alphaproteobacteria bacterium]|nr:hypothetical protein [Alphaproteobacteria bacterium]
MLKTDLTRQESQLVLSLKKFEANLNRIPYDALYLQTSVLPESEKSNFLSAVNDMLQPMILLHKWQKFFLGNDDIVLLFSPEQKDELEAIIFKIKFFVPEESSEDLTKIYTLKKQFKEFMALVNSQVGKKKETNNTDEKAAPAKAVAAGAAKEKDKPEEKIKKQPLTPKMLSTVENSLKGTDFANMIRRQSVCAVVGSSHPQSMFDEVFVSVADLRDTMLPNVDFSLTPWLFQHLTETLDKRVLSHINRHDEGSFKSHFSVNLNVSTILSPDFVSFDKEIPSTFKNTIFLELQPVDIFSDLASYIMAKNFAKERGYKICVDGISHTSLRYIDRERLGADLIKMFWSQDILRRLEENDETLQEDVKRNGPSRMVLARVDDAKAIDVGHTLGINIFQGRYVQKMLSSAPGKRRVTSFYIGK